MYLITVNDKIMMVLSEVSRINFIFSYNERSVKSKKKSIQESVELDIPVLNSFVSWAKWDYEAVRNCTMYGYSNGLAEGIINEIKVIMRIMYGR